MTINTYKDLITELENMEIKKKKIAKLTIENMKNIPEWINTKEELKEFITKESLKILKGSQNEK